MSKAERARARFALAFDRKVPAGPCPSPEDILCWHEKALDAARADAVRRHVAHCDSCFVLWSGLVDVGPMPVEQQATAAAPRWWQRWRVGPALPGLVAAVAAVALWLGTLDSDPLPGYNIQLRGGMDVRGTAAAAGPLTLIDETLLEIVLTPAIAVDGTIAMRLYAQAGDLIEPVDAKVQITDKGVASIEGLVGTDIVVPPATDRLLVAVGRAGKLPPGVALARELGDRTSVSTSDWQGWSIVVTINP